MKKGSASGGTGDKRGYPGGERQPLGKGQKQPEFDQLSNPEAQRTDPWESLIIAWRDLEEKKQNKAPVPEEQKQNKAQVPKAAFEQGTARAIHALVSEVEIMLVSQTKDDARFRKLMKNVLLQAANAQVGLNSIERFLNQEADAMGVPKDNLLKIFRAELPRVRDDLYAEMPNLPKIKSASLPPQVSESKNISSLESDRVARAAIEKNLGSQLANLMLQSRNMPLIDVIGLGELSETVKTVKIAYFNSSGAYFKQSNNSDLESALNKLDALLDKAAKYERPPLPNDLEQKIIQQLNAFAQDDDILDELAALDSSEPSLTLDEVQQAFLVDNSEQSLEQQIEAEEKLEQPSATVSNNDISAEIPNVEATVWPKSAPPSPPAENTSTPEIPPAATKVWPKSPPPSPPSENISSAENTSEQKQQSDTTVDLGAENETPTAEEIQGKLAAAQKMSAELEEMIQKGDEVTAVEVEQKQKLETEPEPAAQSSNTFNLGNLGKPDSAMYHLRFGYRVTAQNLPPDQYMKALKEHEPALHQLAEDRAKAGATGGKSSWKEWWGTVKSFAKQGNFGAILMTIGSGAALAANNIKALGKLITNPRGAMQDRREAELRQDIQGVLLEMQNRAGAGQLQIEATRPLYNSIAADLKNVGSNYNELREKYSGTSSEITTKLVEQYIIQRDLEAFGREKDHLINLDLKFEGRAEYLSGFAKKVEQYIFDNPVLTMKQIDEFHILVREAQSQAMIPADLPPAPKLEPQTKATSEKLAAQAAAAQNIPPPPLREEQKVATNEAKPAKIEPTAQAITATNSVNVVMTVTKGEQLGSLMTTLQEQKVDTERKDHPIGGKSTVKFDCDKSHMPEVATALTNVTPELTETNFNSQKSSQEFTNEFKQAVESKQEEELTTPGKSFG